MGPPDVSEEDEWYVYHQIVVPSVIALNFLTWYLSGHLGINMTYDEILNYFTG